MTVHSVRATGAGKLALTALTALTGRCTQKHDAFLGVVAQSYGFGATSV